MTATESDLHLWLHCPANLQKCWAVQPKKPFTIQKTGQKPSRYVSITVVA
jgi:hypothetical protein